MKQRLILFFGTLVLLLAALGVYKLLAGREGLFSLPRRGETSDGSSGPGDDAPLPPIDIGLLIMTRDDQGRLTGIYRADDWEKGVDGSYLLDKPHVRIFQTSGQELSIRADKGTIYAEELAGSFDVRHGSLEGNVEVIFDRSVGQHEGAIEERPDDTVRIYLEDVSFSHDMLELTTDNDVTVFCREADIIGRGLVVRWNEDPAELRLLKIVHGQYMVVKAVAEDFDVVSLPGSQAKQTGDFEASIPAGPRPLSDDERLVPAKAQPSTKPASAPAVVTASIIKAQSKKTEEPPKPKRRNMFRATFFDNVNVASGDRRIEGADRLSLTFQWEGGRRARDRQSSEAAPAPPTRPAPYLAAQPVAPKTQPTTSPAGGKALPTTRPGAKPPPGQIHIMWSGPLVLEPVGYVDNPSVEKFRVEAEGDELLLADGRSEVACGKFIYRHPERSGMLSGSNGPVRMSMPGQGKVVSQLVRFDTSRELVELIGAGYIVAVEPADQGPASTQPATQAATQPANQRRIKWDDSVTVRIGTIETIRPDGTTESRPFISEAVFRGNVEMTEGQTGDYVRGDRVHVWLADSPSGAWPTKAVATGNVLARQESSEIVADKVTVNFEQRPADQMKDDSPSFRQTEIVAAGNVRVTDRRGDQATEATADTITVDTSDPARRQATLIGAPARISQGEHKICGGEIRLREFDQAASVIGPGTLESVTDRDLEGRKLDQPRPVKITWAESMHYRGADDQAELTGAVELISGRSTIKSDHMVVTFKEDSGQADAEATTRPAQDDSSRQALSFDMDRFGSGRLSRVSADGNVMVRYQTRDQGGKIEQEMQLRAEELNYDARSERIDCTGYGTLLIQDYRPADAPEEIEADDPGSGRIERPWQTAFEWQNMMQLMLGNRMVIMDGGVSMVHLSGSHIEGAEQLDLAGWRELTEGRTVTLGCGKLMAQFSPPEADETADQAAKEEMVTFDPGSRVGDLELFIATRDVVLKDKDWELQGQQLSYMRQKGFAILQGHLEGEPSFEARVLNEGQVFSSPRFLCYLKDGHVQKVEVMRPAGAGSR